MAWRSLARRSSQALRVVGAPSPARRARPCAWMKVSNAWGVGSVMDRLLRGTVPRLRKGGVVPLEGGGLRARSRAPHLHRPVPARRGQAQAVGAESHAADVAGVPREDEG